MKSKLIILTVLLTFSSINLKAATINVSSIAALQSAINGSVPGDVINLADGHYTNNSIAISKSGITVQATTSGGVYLDGTNSISISGSNNTFGGFQFVSGTITGIVINVTGHLNTLTQLNFNGYSAQKYIRLIGQNNIVSYCNIQSKPVSAPAGDLIQVDADASVIGNNTIRYCSFQHMPGAGGDNGNECIRIGESTMSTFVSRTVVEYCYFEDTGLGDSEAISVKSRENVLRYNTMNNNTEAMFCFRRGDNNVAYGNFFINSGGLRAKEANNIFCYNNYFEKSGATGSMNAVSYVYYTANSTYVLDNINFFHNTFVDCGDIDMGGTGATNGTWANNIFKKTGTIFSNANSGTTFKNNIYTGSLGITIPSGMTKIDPKLALNSDGYYGLTATSPAIGAATSAYPAMLNLPKIDTLLLDIKGLTRPASRLLKDLGCEQFNAMGTVTNRPLKLTDVGPSYIKGLTTVAEVTVNRFNLNLSPNPVKDELSIAYTLDYQSKISLDIFNLSGICVKTILANVHQPSGNYLHSVNVSRLNDGVYFVKMSSSEFSKTIKLIVK